MDAEQYYEQGIAAVKEGDMVKGRKLLFQSLRIDKNNDTAWLWLARTMVEPEKQLECAKRALAINPNNSHALKLKQSLTPSKSLNDDQQRVINRNKVTKLIREGDALVKLNRQAEAIDKWIMALDIQADHEETMQKVVAYFMERDMYEDIKILLYNAVDKGTDNATILVSALDVAKRDHDVPRIDALNEIISSAKWTSPKRILKIANQYVEQDLYDNATRVLLNGLNNYPDEPNLLNRIAIVYDKMGRKTLALQYYERLANTSGRSKLGKQADKHLALAVPIMTDKERGSLWMAWREVFGLLLFFFLMAFLDAGLNLVAIGAGRWVGVLLALLGGYLYVTSTSSPQQAPIAALFGGKLPEDNPKTPQRKLHPFTALYKRMGIAFDEESYHIGPIHEPTQLPILPDWTRWTFGILGGILLILAFFLVLPTAFQTLIAPDLRLDQQFLDLIASLQ